MNCLDFSNKYFDKSVVTVQGNFFKKMSEIPVLRTLRKSALKKVNGIQETLLTCFRFQGFKDFSLIQKDR